MTPDTSPVDRFGSPFVQFSIPRSGGEDPDGEVRGSFPVVGLHKDGTLPSSSLDLLRTLDPSFPARLRTHLGPSGSVHRIHDELGSHIAFGVVAPESSDHAFTAGARLGYDLSSDMSLNLGTLPPLDLPRLIALAEGLVLADKLPARDSTTPKATVWLPDHLDRRETEALRRAVILAQSTRLARDLAAVPSNTKTPDWLSDQAMALTSRGLEVSRIAVDELRERGFGGVLAVGAGSGTAPNVTVLRWPGTDSGKARVLVGKGITFDSGGLSIKPSDTMPLMKTDMSGAAAVIGAMGALTFLRPSREVVGVIACAENMPDGGATRPGDVLTHFGGRTTEVLNTDAEGRLVLADALAFATSTFDAEAIVDIATLTGSATVGLGRQHAAFYSNAEQITREMRDAAERSREPIWPMPLVPEYRSAIHSTIADAANTNTDTTTSAGSITAALFLEPFAGEIPWAHFDMAGIGRRTSAEPGRPKGPTGFGARILAEWACAGSPERP